MSLRGLEEGAVFAERYRVARCIAAGGMGAVYEVIHLETERRRALKVMHPHTIERDDLRARFKQEARVAAGVESEHIVDVFDAGFDEKTQMPFLVMELLRGEELGKYLQRVKRLPHDEVLMYLHQTSLALDKTHKARIVHRDLKPENLFLCERDEGPPRIKILDFGIAKIIAEGATKDNATKSLGTPLYMAPEQFMPGGKVSPASDIFALGMIAYTLLVGAPYWRDEQTSSENVFSFVMAAMNGPKEPATERASRVGVSLSPAFDEWFVKVCAKAPADRFPSASMAVQALADALERPRPGYGASGAGRSMLQSTPETSLPSATASRGATVVMSGSGHVSDPRPRFASVPASNESNSAAGQAGAPLPNVVQSGQTLVASAVTSSQNVPRRSSAGVVVAVALSVVLVGGGAIFYLMSGPGKTSSDSKNGEAKVASSTVAAALPSMTAPQIEPVASLSATAMPSPNANPSASSLGAEPSGNTSARAVGQTTTIPAGTARTTTKTSKTKTKDDKWGQD